jgi:hypothetical protein
MEQDEYDKRMEFTVKDSGERRQFESGMQRDTDTDKVRYDLVFDGPLVERLARHLTLGAKKYEARNWMKASGPEELERFRQSAVRHFVQWLRGDVDEDHFSAVCFNMNGVEFVLEKLRERQGEEKSLRSTVLPETPRPDHLPF